MMTKAEGIAEVKADAEQQDRERKSMKFRHFLMHGLSWMLVCTSNLIATMSLCGYAFNLNALYNWNFRTTYPMAFNTALCLWCTSMSVILILSREKSE
jgi:hypothetical protein